MDEKGGENGVQDRKEKAKHNNMSQYDSERREGRYVSVCVVSLSLFLSMNAVHSPFLPSIQTLREPPPPREWLRGVVRRVATRDRHSASGVAGVVVGQETAHEHDHHSGDDEYSDDWGDVGVDSDPYGILGHG
jgi:hypothetical protein